MKPNEWVRVRVFIHTNLDNYIVDDYGYEGFEEEKFLTDLRSFLEDPEIWRLVDTSYMRVERIKEIIGYINNEVIPAGKLDPVWSARLKSLTRALEKVEI